MTMNDNATATPTAASTYTVQETAEKTGLSVHTLRYYERMGLIPSVGRDASSGHRRYTAQDIGAIGFLKRMKATGMPIREMQRYVTLIRKGDSTKEERRQMLIAHREVVLQQIAELQQNVAVMDYKIESYACIETTGIEPPFLDGIDGFKGEIK
jgi:DNA-binding transcriptional MerR regulator